MLKPMTYMTDTMRVELSLPVHIMLSVLLSGANCADPGPMPEFKGDLYHLANLDAWRKAWIKHEKRVAEDPEFARSYKMFQETKANLVEACDEALRGVYPENKELSLLRRIERTHREIVAPYVSDRNADPRKIGIIAFFLIQHLVDTETLIIPEDSSFGKALDTMLPALSPCETSTDQEVEDYEFLNRSAKKQINKVLINLKNEGYYKDIPLVDYQ